MNGSPFGMICLLIYLMIYLLNGTHCMILSHANDMECSKHALLFTTVLKGMESRFSG